MELQNIRKGNEDKLSAVGVHINNKELHQIIFKVLPKEFASFSLAIRTRDDSLSYEKLLVLLHTQEQSMNESSEFNASQQNLAMFAARNFKQTSSVQTTTMALKDLTEVADETNSREAEEEDSITSTTQIFKHNFLHLLQIRIIILDLVRSYNKRLIQ